MNYIKMSLHVISTIHKKQQHQQDKKNGWQCSDTESLQMHDGNFSPF